MDIILKSKPIIAPYRSMHGLYVFIRWLESQGIEVAPVLHGFGLKRADCDNPDMLISFQQELELTEALLGLSADPALGLRLVRDYHIGFLGKWGMAVSSCATGLEAFQSAFALSEVISNHFQYILQVQGPQARFSLHEIIDLGPTRRFIQELYIVGFYRICCEILREKVRPIEVRLAYPRPEYAKAYHAIFNCPVTFGAEETQVLFPSAYLTRPLPGANALTKNIYEKDCLETMAQIGRLTTISEHATLALQQHKEGFLKRPQLAKRLNMSDQQLKRRLAAEGKSYKALQREARTAKAVHLLETTALPIAEIAHQLGYSDVSNFHRAFKSWTGRTPRAYRCQGA